jgi:hypothetical protein
MKSTQSQMPIETAIPLLEPVRIYTAKELAAMPLSKMNEAIEAQEAYFVLEHTSKMGGAGHSHPPSNARWHQAISGQREIAHALQNQQRLCRAENNSPVGKTWFGQIDGRC